MASGDRDNPETLLLQLALRASGIGVWSWDLRTNVFHYSDRARAIFGLPAEGPVTYDMVFAVTHPEDFPMTSAQARRALDPSIRENLAYEYRAIRADTGAVIWVEADGEAVFETVDGEVKATRYVGTIKDITEAKAQRLALEDSERRLNLAIAAARMAVWDYDVGTGAFSGSRQLKHIFGFSDDAFPSVQDYRELHLPGEYEKVQEAARAAMSAGRHNFEVEYEIRRVDGNQRWLLLRAEILVNAEGAPVRAVGVVMDIDEQKRGAERQETLVHELNHRVKNSLAIVSALAHQSFRNETGSNAFSAFTSRLKALATANDLLIRAGWESFSLFQLVEEVAAPFLAEDKQQVRISGTDAMLLRRYNEPLALALHELATNASKYGALSTEGGFVTVQSTCKSGTISLEWEEHDGPPVTAPAKSGFGTRLLSRILAQSVRSVSHELRQAGVYCRIELDQ